MKAGAKVRGRLRDGMHRGLTLALLALAGAWLAGCAQDSLGPEYTEISEEESGLQFYGPGLKDGFRRIIAGQDEQFITRMMASFGPPEGDYPHGQLMYIEMPPGRHFTRIDPPQKSIGSWGLFRDREIVNGPVGSGRNSIGRIDYAVFTADGLSCLILKQPFGTVYGLGRGTMLITGYYCKGVAPMMDAAEAEAIVSVVGHREHGPVTPPADWN